MARGLSVTGDSILACYTTSLYWSIMTVLSCSLPSCQTVSLRWSLLSGYCHSTFGVLFSQVSTIGYGDVTPQNSAERIFVVSVLHVHSRSKTALALQHY